MTGVFYENSRTRFQDVTDGSSSTICISETIKSEPGGPATWDGVSPITGFVLTQGNDNSTNGPELTHYATQCHAAGLLLNLTRGSRWLFAAPGHSMYNHLHSERSRRRLSRRTSAQQPHELLVGSGVAQHRRS